MTETANIHGTDGDSLTVGLPRFDLEELPGYVAPPWATHEFQTVPGLIKRQMRRFGKQQ